MDTDFLVVGAGPVGLTAALWLAQFGHRVTIVDAKSTCSTRSRALAIHAPTIEMLDRLGVAERLLEEGIPVRATRVSSEQRELARLTFENVDSAYKFILALPQTQTEAILRDALAARGIDIRWGHTLTDLDQDEAGCVATFDDGSKCTCRWIVAADGATSTVRRRLGIAFEGEKTTTWFVLADVRMAWAEPPDEFRMFYSDNGLLLFIPLHNGMHRIVATLPKHRSGPPDTSEQGFRRLVDQRTPLEQSIAEFSWRSALEVRRCLAEQYRVGRVFLTGDAAHTHSPFGGQGMNMGIGDAANLAWKLDLVQRGLADDELLQTYETERRRAATDVLAATQVGNPLGASSAQLIQSLQRVDTSSTGRYEIRNQMTMAAVRFDSAIVGPGAPLDPHVGAHDAVEDDVRRFHFRHGPKPGERAPDLFIADGVTLLGATDATRHTLLLFAGEAGAGWCNGFATSVNEAYRNRIECVVVLHTEPETNVEEVRVDSQRLAHTRYGTTAEAAYLVRPDGFVAWRSQPARFEELADFLSAAYGW